MAQSRNKRLKKIVLIITFIVFSWLLFEFIVRGFDVVKQEYGINPASFVKVLIGSEIFFDLGIILIIFGSGALKLRLKHIFNLDFQDIVFENKLVYSGFTINRIAAFIPPIYLLWNGWGKLPILITVLLLIETGIVILITTIPFEFKKFFIEENN
jgi:hypothetical protein